LPASDEDDGDDGEEFFDEQGLLKRLIDYQRFKRAAQALGIRPQLEVDLFRRGGSDFAVVAQDPVAVPLRKEEPGKLLDLYRELLRRKGRVFVHRVALENVSVRQKMIELLDAVQVKPALRLAELITETRSRIQKIAVFLAVLELLRLRLLRLSQAEGGEAASRGWTLARGETAAAGQLDHYEEDFRS
jgi:segregation and condensation protein A